MLYYIYKRLLSLVPLFFGITLICFFVIRLAPGSPIDTESAMNPQFSQSSKDRFIAMYNLDKPLYTQYWLWLKKIVQLDFGESFSRDGRPVWNKISECIGVTIGIQAISMFIIFTLSVIIGVLSAWYKNTIFDRTMTVLVFIGFAVPTFWLAMLCMYLFGVVLGWLPISGLTSWNYANLSLLGKIADIAKHLILPIFISTIGGLAGMSRFMRSSLLEVLSTEYVLAARSRGLSTKLVLFKHALKNALLPAVTLIGLSIPGLISGGVIFESIFSIPGMGQLFYSSVLMRDYPTVMGVLVIGAVLTLFGNLLADIMYALIDPRIRYSRGGK